MHYYLTFSIFHHHPYHMQVLEFDLNDVSISCFFQTMVQRGDCESVKLIETTFLKELLDLCTEQPLRRVSIRGPSGTGKSTSSLYLWNKLQYLTTPIRFLAWSPLCMNPTIFMPYIQSFCEGNQLFFTLC